MTASSVLPGLAQPIPARAAERGAPPESRSPSRLPRLALQVGVAAVLLAGLLATGCNHAPPPAKATKAVDVIVTTPITDEVTDYQDFTGRLDAIKTVDIRPRVSGYVVTAFGADDKGTPPTIKEGDQVKEGEVLFEIDPRTYQADLNLAEANLRLGEADLRLQERNAERARQLLLKNAIAREDYDTILATRDKSAANIEALQATRDRTRLYFNWTRVVAPISGRISRRNVDPGNLVVADNTMLTTIVTEERLYAYFDVDERTYLDLLETGGGSGSGGTGMAEKGSWMSSMQFPVLMRLANAEEFNQAGTVDFLDNRINGTTGTIRMRGVFANSQHRLKPGLFVRIRLPIAHPYKALLVPDEALQSDQGRKYVYVVKTEKFKKEDGSEEERDVVEYRAVQLGQAIHGLRQLIKDGLKEGERVIVTGMQRVRPKAVVKAKLKEPPKKPDSPLGRQMADFLHNRAQTLAASETKRQPKEAAGASGTGLGGGN